MSLKQQHLIKCSLGSEPRGQKAQIEFSVYVYSDYNQNLV